MVSFRKNMNSSQFFIALSPLPWLNGLQVVFGEVADHQSMETILEIERLGTENGEPQVKSVYISHSVVQATSD